MSDRVFDLVGTGYGDGNLDHSCVSCKKLICKEVLSAAKFVQDATTLLSRSVPMPGTVLDPQTGVPERESRSETKELAQAFPNRMIQLDLRITLMDLFQTEVHPTMDIITRMIEDVLKNPIRLCHINGSAYKWGTRYSLHPKSKVCVRKMLSRYRDNFSPFALDLGGAVMRQGVFVDKMVNLDWLHSPSAKDTMKRLLVKYKNFLMLMRRYPSDIAVPTLDVDLAWHTHQLDPAAYYGYTTTHNKVFIDHDDKIAEIKLNQAFEWTSKMYQEEFNEVYSECTCWYCEGSCNWAPRRHNTVFVNN